MNRTAFWIGLSVLAVVAMLWLWVGGGPRIESGSALVLDVQGAYVETSASPLLARVLGDGPRPLIGLLSELTKAERDDRLESVVLRIRPLQIGWGKAQELRDAIARLGAEGRRTVAWLEVESFGPNLEYYVASAADEVWVAPATRNPFVGLAAEYLFLGGFFEKLGVDVEYERVGRYKTAVESFAESKMSEANREMTTALLDSIESQFLSGIGAGRGLDPEAVREAVDAAPISPAEMQELGLVDGVGFFDELMDHLGDPPVVEAEEYARVDAESVGFDPVATLALVYGSGAVVTGEGGSDLGGDPVLAAGTVARAIEDASMDSEVSGILFRIDSPGGSALASDLVWHATQRARERGKPVVASFSDVAASGGYYVAAGADRIVAQPGTYTGSIGVFVLRPVLGGLFEKLGIGVEAMTRGTHADLLLASRPLTPRTRARLRADVQEVYELFVSRVAEGRSLPRDAVDAVGRGRVFTGAQAEEAGLVDALGGLRDAVGLLKEEIGLDRDDDVVLVTYPPPRPLAEQIRELLGASLRRAALAGLGDLGDARLAAWLRTLAPLERGAPVLIPPVIPRIR